MALELQLYLSYQIFEEYDLWSLPGIFVVYKCGFLSTLTLFLSSLVMKKKSMKNNSEPALVNGLCFG